VPRHHDNRDFMRAGIFTDSTRRGITVKQRKICIHQNQINTDVGRQSDRHLAILGFDNGNATPRFEHCSQHQARIVVIFDDQHAGSAGIRFPAERCGAAST